MRMMLMMMLMMMMMMMMLMMMLLTMMMLCEGAVSALSECESQKRQNPHPQPPYHSQSGLIGRYLDR